MSNLKCRDFPMGVQVGSHGGEVWIQGLMTKFLKPHISYSVILQEYTKDLFWIVLLMDGVWHISIVTFCYCPFT